MFYFFLLILLLGTAVAGAPPSYSLFDFYENALKTNETPAIAEEEIRAARARFHSALGEILPQISATFAETLQDAVALEGGDSDFSDTFTKTSRPEVKMTVTQPLFQGFKAFHALKGASSLQSQKKFEWEESKRALFRDVTLAFYSVALLDQQISATREIIHVLRKEVQECATRVELGKSRKSEKALQEAELARREAELEKMKGDRMEAEEFLSFLSGLTPPFSVRLIPEHSSPTLQDYLRKAEARPDLLAYAEAKKLAGHEVKVKGGELLPHADAETNYYPYRTGFQQDIKWDVVFSVSAPIFNWGNIGDLKESKARERQASLYYEQKKREIQREVKTAWALFEASRRELERLESAYSKAKASYLLQKEDFEHGLISTADLLGSQRLYFEMLKARNESRVEKALQFTRLQIQAGMVPQ